MYLDILLNNYFLNLSLNHTHAQFSSLYQVSCTVYKKQIFSMYKIREDDIVNNQMRTW